jgi:DNA-binding transcriptional LysR family regulator
VEEFEVAKGGGVWVANGVMTLTQLGVWIALIETRSFSRAAVRLGITQSGVSHAIGALEKQFKVSLIDRDAAEFALTQAGAQFSIRAREMLALSDTLTQEMSDLHGLRLGTNVTSASCGV